jgi:hypothetical protein
MNILLLGSGGREHAFARSLSASALCSNLFIAPGNAGTAEHGTNVNVSPNDFDAVKALVLAKHIQYGSCGTRRSAGERNCGFFCERRRAEVNSGDWSFQSGRTTRGQ